MTNQRDNYTKSIERQYETLFQSSKDALMILSNEEGFLAGNKSTIEMFKCGNEKKFISLTPPDLSPDFQPDGTPSGIKALEMMNIALEKGDHFFEWKHKRFHGEEFYATVLLTKTELSGKVVLQATVRDISVQKEQDKINLEQREIEKKYRIIFEQSKDLIFISNAKGRFIDMNPAGIKILGYDNKEELLKIDIKEELYFNKEKRDKFKEEMSRKGFVKDFQITLKKKDSTPIEILETATMILDEISNEEVYMGIMRDITAQIQHEEMLLKMTIEQEIINKELKETQAFVIQQEKMASLGGLAAGIAHEINNPLGFVMGNFRALKDYIDIIEEYLILISKKPEDPDLIEKLDESKKEIDFILKDLKGLFSESEDGFERISTIVENMRQFSRVDSKANMTTINLNDSIRNTLVIAANSYKYVAEVKLNLSKIPEINCNGSEINQVLLNIIVNAAQAIEEMKRDDKGTINIKTYTENGMVCCSISDTGPGIYQNNINKIFDPFFTTKEVGKGTGMGLSISYDIIVNKHKGQLIVESNIEGGATFLIRLHQNINKTSEGERL